MSRVTHAPYRDEDQHGPLIQKNKPMRSGMYWHRKPGDPWKLIELAVITDSPQTTAEDDGSGEWVDPLDPRHLENVGVLIEIRHHMAQQTDQSTRRDLYHLCGLIDKLTKGLQL